MSSRRDLRDLRKTRNRPAARNEDNKEDKLGRKEHALSPELQQAVLNTFVTAFSLRHDATDELKATTQKVKGHLFDRDFVSAFGQPSYLRAYASRWSAARALGYAHILTAPARTHLLGQQKCDVDGSDVAGVAQQPEDLDQCNPEKDFPGSRSGKVSVVCIGGGAGAEIIAIAAAYNALGLDQPLSVHAVDIADWSEPFEKLSAALIVPPASSKHVSDIARSRPEYQSLLPESAKLDFTFQQQDILSYDTDAMQGLLGGTTLCTIMFTLNELFSTSLPKTTSFLLSLTTAMPKHSHLLVVDSPGSYSEIQLGKKPTETTEGKEALPKTKKYPMKWLLDHTLLEVAKQGDEAVWEKIEDEESSWFRLEQKAKLRYPIELENMRYQLHLYRKV